MMTLAFKICLFWIFWTFVQEAYGNSGLFVQNYSTGISWFDASTRCEDLGHELEHNITNLSHVQEFQENEFWIGTIIYNEMTSWIQPLGCFDVSKMHVPFIEKTTSVGYCQDNCKSSKYFIYQKFTNSCQCLNSNAFKNNSIANVTVCNFNTSKSYMLVFEGIDYNSSDNDKNKCLSSICDANGKETLCPTPCNVGDPNVNTLCEDGKQPSNSDTWGLNYTSARDKCWKKDKILKPVGMCSNGSWVRSWTSAFRVDIKVKYHKAKPGKDIPVACLIGKRSPGPGNNIQIQEKACNCTLKLFACKSNVETTEHNDIHAKTTSIVTDTAPNTETNKESTSNDYTSEHRNNFGYPFSTINAEKTMHHSVYKAIPSTPVSREVTTGHSKPTTVSSKYSVSERFEASSFRDTNMYSTTNGDASGHSNVKTVTSSLKTGALVGGIMVGVIAVVVVSLLLPWIRRRRNKNTAKPKQVNTIKDVNHVCNKQYGIVEDQINPSPEYAVINNGNEHKNLPIPEYAVVNKGNNYQNIPMSEYVNAQHTFAQEKTCTVAVDNEYDKLNNVMKRNKSKDGNVYGITGQFAEGEYDTMSKMFKSNVKHAADLYDTNDSIF